MADRKELGAGKTAGGGPLLHRLHKVNAVFLCLIWSTVNLAHAQTPKATYVFAYDKVIYRGQIQDEVVDRLIADATGRKVEQLIIDSVGGEVRAAVRFGEWVHATKLDVRIDRKCISSCANYVFPAGNRKYISDGAIVLWHGGADQKNFRLFREEYELLKRKREKSDIAADEKESLDKGQIRYNNLVESMMAQRRLYSVLGIDEKILLAGQEPTAFDADMWTMPIESIERFGIRNVFAEAAFGTPRYVQDWIAKSSSKWKIVSLRLTEAGEIIELR